MPVQLFSQSMKLLKVFKEEKGLTLVEILLVSAFIVLFSFFTIPLTIEFYYRQSSKEVETFLESNLRAARERSMLGKGEGYHGVKFFEKKYIIFEGQSYDLRNSLMDVTVPLPLGVDLDYPHQEIVYERETGELNVIE